jgi:D-alanyl-D-alanine carboxypeptidase
VKRAVVAIALVLSSVSSVGLGSAQPHRRAAPAPQRSGHRVQAKQQAVNHNARPSQEAARRATFVPGAARAGVANLAARGESQPERDLQDALDQAVGSPWMKQAVNGVLVMDIRTGKTIYSLGADRQLNPASNVKLVSTATALDALGPEFNFATRLLGAAPDAGGVVAGDVYLVGSFDPTLRQGDLQRLAAALAE